MVETNMARPVCVALVGHTAQMGGAEHALMRLVEAMDRSRWRPVVVFGEDGPAVERMRRESLEVYVCSSGPCLAGTRKESLSVSGIFQAERIRALLSQVYRLCCFFRRRGVQLVHTNSLKSHVYGGIAARILGIPLVWHLRDSIREPYLPAPAVRCMRMLGGFLPDAVVAVSRSVAHDLLGSGGNRKCAIVYDGLREAEFAQPPAAAHDTEGAPPVIGMVGRITPWKGQHVFLEAAALLKTRGFKLRYEILGAPLFGEREYFDALRTQARRSGLEGDVHFHGAVEDVACRIRQWRAVVHASVSPDPCPNVILEAMAAGVPVVGSDGGGVPEILNEGRFGWLHPMGDALALAGVLETVLKAPAKAREMAFEAKEYASRVFTAVRVAREVERCWAEFDSAKIWSRRCWPQLEEGIVRQGFLSEIRGRFPTRGAGGEPRGSMVAGGEER